MEYHRKQAKALVRAYRARDTAAVRRAEAVLGKRATERFLLSDAQHVIARELGHRSWPDLVRRTEDHPVEIVRDVGVEYVSGDPVLVRVRRRGRRLQIDDRAGAVTRAGRPPGWLEVARRVVEDEHRLNVNRAGVVFVPAFDRGRDLTPLVVRVADASSALYQELLELV
jgi:hypothetical protein